jgi:hypothetical protein
MIAELIALVAAFWKADEDRRDSSLLGESPMDRQSRRWVAIICGTLIALLAAAVIIWEWITW